MSDSARDGFVTERGVLVLVTAQPAIVKMSVGLPEPFTTLEPVELTPEEAVKLAAVIVEMSTVAARGTPKEES